jgi:hypothetical protein
MSHFATLPLSESRTMKTAADLGSGLTRSCCCLFLVLQVSVCGCQNMSLTHPESSSFCCWVRVRAKGNRPSLKILPISAHALVEVDIQRTGQPRDLESKKHVLFLFAAKSMVAYKEIFTKKALVRVIFESSSATLCAVD